MIGVPDPEWGEAILAVVALKHDAGRRPPRSCWRGAATRAACPRSSAPSASSWSTRCPRTPSARSQRASCATATGPAPGASLTDVAIVGVGLTAQAQAPRALDALGVPGGRARSRWTTPGSSAARSTASPRAGPGPAGRSSSPARSTGPGCWASPVRWIGDTYPQGVPAVLDAAAAIAGRPVRDGADRRRAGRRPGPRPAAASRSTRAPTTSSSRRGASFTAAQFALVASCYLHRFRSAREAMAEVAATIRNHGRANPDAVLPRARPVSPPPTCSPRRRSSSPSTCSTCAWPPRAPRPW